MYDMKITLALKSDQDLNKTGEEEEIYTRRRHVMGKGWV